MKGYIKKKLYKRQSYMGYHARYEKYFFYGMLILICLLIIGGLLAALTHREEGLIGRMRREEQKNADEGEKAPEEEKAPEIVINNPNIRVLIMTNGYANIVHPSVEMSSASGFCITFGDQTQEAGPEQPLTFAPDDPRFQSGQIRVSAKDGGEIALNSIQRGCGTPSYAGVIELRTTAEGIAVINELPVETYLCRVVPSEMPCTYELEALKAQAVCARSYAYQQMQSFAYPEYEAHVNDSTDYQVYGNSLPQEATNQAVAETGGQVVRYQDRLVTTYYYSTSCGKTAGVEAWGTAPNAENQYLQSVEVKDEQGDYEAGLPWYRWEAKIPAGTLSALISQNTGTNVGTLQSVEVTKSGAGGVALQICATGDAGSVTVDTENKIRRALGGSGYEIVNQAGTAVASTALLPSAFFTIRKEGDVFIVSGGGFGHGIGMSQNGANEMAKKGKNYIDILTMFFREVSVGG